MATLCTFPCVERPQPTALIISECYMPLGGSEADWLHSGQYFIEQCEHSGVTPHVIDVDQRGASVPGPHSTDCKIVSPIKVVGDLISCSNQCTKGTTPHCPAIGWTHRQRIHVSCELATAPVPLIFYKSPSLFDDLNLEGLRHDNALSLQTHS